MLDGFGADHFGAMLSAGPLQTGRDAPKGFRSLAYRIALLTHDHGARAEQGLTDALVRRFDTRVIDVDSGPIDIEAVSAGVDAVVTAWRILQMREAGIDWRRSHAPLVMIEHDALNDAWPGKLNSVWSEFLRKNRFDLVLVSGQMAADRLSTVVDTRVLYKAYANRQFFPGGERRGICFYGTTYRGRAAMLRTLKNHSIPIEMERTSYQELPAMLRSRLGLVTNTMRVDVRFGKPGRAIERFRPGTVLQLGPSPEPMLKHFEASASACAVFTDPIPDLGLLGFKDGESFIEYTSFEDLAERCIHYLDRVDDLAAIGDRAATLCLSRHTWDHRAAEFESLVFG